MPMDALTARKSMPFQDVVRRLLEVVKDDQIKVNEPLEYYTYTKIGGKADILVLPATFSQVKGILLRAKQLQVPFMVMGNGSNVIVKDGGIRGIVIVMTRLTSISLQKNQITAQSGIPLAVVSRYAWLHHLSGLEFAVGIPGTVGGAVCMNAGAYGGQISEVLERAVVLTKDGQCLSLTHQQLHFEYRDSVIQRENHIVLEATFHLEQGDGDEIKAKMDDLTQRRASKQPLEYPSCGSVFKRPQNDYAARLIQVSGLQGFRIGDAQVSTKHAGFIVNLGHATASDYIQVIRHVQQTVLERNGIALNHEVKIVGEDV